MAPEKRIQYDPDTKDFVMYYGETLVGWRHTRQEAEEYLDQYVYVLLRNQASPASYELTPVTGAPAYLIAIEINGICRGYALNYGDAEIMVKALIAEA